MRLFSSVNWTLMSKVFEIGEAQRSLVSTYPTVFVSFSQSALLADADQNIEGRHKSSKPTA